ncbi:MAG: hypothetical protein NVS4B11_30960 [Ktedonobacteraceae bacterium]
MCRATGETHAVVSNATEPVAQGNWPTFHGNVNRDGSGPASGNGNTLRLAWTFCTGGSVFSSPVVQNGVVYVASTNTTLTALDIQSAKMLWQIQADDAFFGTPALQNGVLYVASLSGIVYAINAKDGFVRWHTQLDTPGAKIWSSPAIANGLLIIGAASTLSENPKKSGQVLAFDTTTGKQRWRVYIEHGGKAGGGVWSSPAIDVASNTVYVGTGDPDDGVEALNLHTGHLLWHWRSVLQDVGDTDVGAGPLLYRGVRGQLHVVVGGKNGNMYNLDAKTGSPLWHTRVGEHVFSSPAFANGTLYAVGVVGQKATAWALDAQTGNVHWHHDLSVIVYASPAIVGQTLYLALGDGFEPGDGGIMVLNATNGQQLQYINLHSTASSSPAVLPAWLFVGAHDGNLYAFVR